MKNREVVEAILKVCPMIGDEEHTVDRFKYGDPEAECRGIVTSIAPTIEVIRKTAEQGYNLLIVHEPTFWTHEDRLGWLEGDPLYEAKTKLLKEHGIAVWRFHDHMHAHKPDLVFSGMTKELGWEKYDNPDYRRSRFTDRKHALSTLWELPGIKFTDIADMIKEKLGLEGIHYVGNKDAVIYKAAVSFHELEYEPQEGLMQIMKDENLDLIIPGESVNWCTQYYVRDAAALGWNKVVLLIGHFNVESLGMKSLAENWLPEVLGNAVPTKYIPAGDSYHYL